MQGSLAKVNIFLSVSIFIRSKIIIKYLYIDTVLIYVKRLNKTGLQPVSRPVELAERVGVGAKSL